MDAIIIGTVMLIIVMMVLHRSRRRATAIQSFAEKLKGEPYMSTADAAAVIAKLEEAGYFKYAEQNKIEDLRANLIESLSEYGILSTLENDSTLLPEDYRYYFLDGEELFELDGVTEKLEFMKPFFNKINLTLNITNHIEEAGAGSNGYIDHFITINGKEYIILAAFDGYGWGETAQRFAEILNDQLAIQQKDERLYLINGANDGAAVFLTQEQFSIINDVIKEDEWKPLKVPDWCKAFEVDPNNYKKRMLR